MAQTSSVQREPSMEEILASIRRIIEDSDSARKSTDDAATEQADSSLDSAVIEVDAFRAELRAARSSETGQAPSLAEVQALVAAESETGAPETYAPPAAAFEDKPETPVLATPEWETAPRVEAPSEEPTDAREPEADFDEQLEAALEQMPLEQSVAVEAPRAEPTVAMAPEPAKPPIVSEHTSRQVAAAFGELSEAFAARSRKTFDEMAAEMLRPMLQEWLDNNLPTLVERLVREEIERVARGG